MSKDLTDLQGLTLEAWADKDLRRPPALRTVADKAGLSGAPSVPLVLKALQVKGYLDSNQQLTRKGRAWLRARAKVTS